MDIDLKRNLSNTDRFIRVFLSFFVLSLAYGKQLPFFLWAVVLLFAGALFLEGILGY